MYRVVIPSEYGICMLYGVEFWKVLDNMPQATSHKIKQQSYAEQRSYDVKFWTNPLHIQHVIYHIMRIIDILLHLTYSLFHIHISCFLVNSGGGIPHAWVVSWCEEIMEPNGPGVNHSLSSCKMSERSLINWILCGMLKLHYNLAQTVHAKNCFKQADYCHSRMVIRPT